MCGRYAVVPSGTVHLPDTLASLVPDFAPRYNLAPGQTAPVIRIGEAKPECVELRWGFRPAWVADQGKAQINARAETVFEKPMFRNSALKRRCLVLASAWYEWKKTAAGKEPCALRLKDQGLFVLAGIWTSGESGTEDSYAIVTKAANPTVSAVHERMPAILDEGGSLQWLEDTDTERLGRLLMPGDRGDLVIYRVGKYVNNPRNNSPECLEAAATLS